MEFSLSHGQGGLPHLDHHEGEGRAIPMHTYTYYSNPGGVGVLVPPGSVCLQSPEVLVKPAVLKQHKLGICSYKEGATGPVGPRAGLDGQMVVWME